MLDLALGRLFAQALVAIARADDEIGPEEGQRLEQRIALRVAGPISLSSRCASDGRIPSASRSATKRSCSICSLE